MIKVLNNITPSQHDDIYNIEFSFTQGEHRSMTCQNIITFDIETSNGWRQKDNSVIGFDHFKYNEKLTDNDGNYFENPMFDSEYKEKIDNGEPVSLLYVWQCAVESQDGPKVFMGRTWDEYFTFLFKLTFEIRRQAVYGFKTVNREVESYCALSAKYSVKIFTYIHNFGFEYQHLLNMFFNEFAGVGRGRKSTHGNVFARQARKPMKGYFNMNKVKIEFRDTLSLTQKTLKNWCKDSNLPVQKLDEPGDYYLKIRTPNTPLVDDEVNYSINDVVSMVYGIEQYREKYGTLQDIPLTQTGEVRRTCRAKVCMINPDWAQKCAEITHQYSLEFFNKLVNLFQGGWTHGNSHYIGKTYYNVGSFDFASSYPAVMCTRRYPVTEFVKCDVNEFSDLEAQDIHTAKYRWFAKIKVSNFVTSKENTYWSSSKVCIETITENNKTRKKMCLENPIVDNGRIFAADSATMFMTDLDWDTFKQAYTIFDGIEVLELYKAEAGYLPIEIIKTVLEYFAYKTSLKGDDSKLSLYTESKQFVNSIYGCAVTKIISMIVNFDKDGWNTKEPDEKDFISTIQENDADNTFLAYQQGIWITAWARHNLWDFILKLDKHIIYCDTDSIKGLFTDEDFKFISDYNDKIAELENHVADTLGFDRDMFTPKTMKGKVKRLGIMEREDDYLEFRTLGAKRYAGKVLHDGEEKIETTIAGLPKSAGPNVIHSLSQFNNHTFWNTIDSEKLMACYNDNQGPCDWTDYLGNTYHSEDRYGICLQPTTFDMGLSEEFEKFLGFLMCGEIDKTDDFFTDIPGILI